MKYKITAKYNFFAGTINQKPDGYLQSDLGRDLLFRQEEDAQKHIDSLNSTVYHLSHGEAGHPSYSVVCF